MKHNREFEISSLDIEIILHYVDLIYLIGKALEYDVKEVPNHVKEHGREIKECAHKIWKICVNVRKDGEGS